MKRIAVLLGILALALAPGMAAAQGFFDGSFFGFGPYFGLGGASSCGEVKAKPPCVLYVGYSGDPGNSTGFSATAQWAGVMAGALDITHRYAVRGLWLGASQTLALSDNAGIVASFWYLFPDKSVDSRETYFVSGGVGLAERTWKTNTQWWYADIIGAFGNLNGFSLLAGFRYDYFTTRFKNPFNAAVVASSVGDTADVKSNGYIPLLGGQVAYSGSYGSLLFRLVGIPTLVGRVK